MGNRRVGGARRGIWVAGIGLSWVGAIALGLTGCHDTNQGAAAPPAPPVLADASCPLQTGDQWQNFMEQTAEHEEWVDTCEDGSCNTDFNAFLTKDVQGVLDKCKNTIAENPRIASCTDRLRRFLPAWTRQHTNHTFGFTMDNTSYYAYEQGPNKPKGLMTVPQPLIDALPDRAKIETALQTAGLHYLVHTSCLGGTRIYITNPDPGGSFDQWILVNLDNTDQTVDTGIPMSFIGVQKKDAAGNKLSQVRLNFRDYFMVANSGGKPGYTLQSYGDSEGKCFSCHVSGTRQLMMVDRQKYVMSSRPVAGETGYSAGSAATAPDIGTQRWNEFNAKLATYGLPDWDGTINAADHGPALGAAQSCTDCHDGVTRGALNVDTSVDQIDRKIWQELVMPPADSVGLSQLLLRKQTQSPPLTASEKDLLSTSQDHHNDILQDYYADRLPSLRSWLLETTCN
jgi:hypothetical protein